MESRAGIFLGAGIAASLDGIVFHQLLQWHHMVMADGPPYWMFTDGLFHAVAVSLLLWGAYLLWRSCSLHRLAADRQMHADLLIGAGIFNLIEGTLVHHVLELHHVKPGPDQLAWDLMFLALGAALVIQGLRLRGHALLK